MTTDIEGLRRSVAAGEMPLRITTHAQVEAFKEGLLLADLLHIFETGRVIEGYEGGRALLFGWASTARIPVHIVVEIGLEELVLVTAYVPDPAGWIDYSRRRRRRRR